MSESIKVGDLVVVVRNSPNVTCECPPGGALGTVFSVQLLSKEPLSCSRCEKPFNGGALDIAVAPDDIGYEISRLKRIPPLSELESEKKKDEVTA